ncbi:unnamed protein product [Timema podura]|uniref:Uncharacterized protein n=1 Tax=Timema podura TaxID=61482 RepID=A0ABN7NXA5_TIMPD|nr:unnamed protein product [Timema podura]
MGGNTHSGNGVTRTRSPTQYEGHEGHGQDWEQPLQPPEGGWGWMVAFGMALIFISTTGQYGSFGLLFDDVLSRLGEQTTGATLIMNALAASVNFTANHLIVDDITYSNYLRSSDEPPPSKHVVPDGLCDRSPTLHVGGDADDIRPEHDPHSHHIQHHIRKTYCVDYSSPMASLVLSDSSQLRADGFEKLPDQIRYPYTEPYDLQQHVFSSCHF